MLPGSVAPTATRMIACFLIVKQNIIRHNRNPRVISRTPKTPMSPTEKFIAARQFLLNNRTDYEKAYREFRWPGLSDFNWARD